MMFEEYIEKVTKKLSEIWEELYYSLNEPIRAGDIQRGLYEEFIETFAYYSQVSDNMELKDYMINAYLLGDNLRKVIDTLDEDIKREIPPIIRNSCNNIYVEYMDYDDKSIVRIVLDCSYNVENDLRKLLDDFCTGWYSDNHYDNSLSFCFDLNPENIEEFTKKGGNDG